MTRWVTKGPPLSLGSLDPSQRDPYHHFRGGFGWESTGNQHPSQRLEQFEGHSKLSLAELVPLLLPGKHGRGKHFLFQHMPS